MDSLQYGSGRAISKVGIEGGKGVPIVSDDTKIKMLPTVNDVESACRAFMIACGLTPTPDAVDQLSKVFLPCLRIMCERPWDPNGATWQQSGILGVLTDIRKKFMRLWERGWKNGKRHDDSAFDLINYIGFYLRSEDNGWGEWGNPAVEE